MSMRCDKYILDAEGNPVAEADLMKWALWMETHPRHVAEDYVGEVRVSTVFLGLDQNPWLLGEDGPPVLWETMIFRGQHDGYQKRYASKAEALAGHEVAVRMVKR